MPGHSTLRYGGNTSCHEIRVGGRLIIFDAGTGIINLGDDIVRDNPHPTLAMFFSHNHHDHISGLLYFKPAYMSSTTMYIFGPADQPGDITNALEVISSPAAHPVPFSQMGMNSTTTLLSSGDVVCWAHGQATPRVLGPGESYKPEDVVVKVMKNRLHPVEGVLNFRLEHMGKSYVYATDVEGDEETGDPELAKFAQDADLLAHDGQYTSEEYHKNRKGWGHSTVAMAIRTARMARVKRLAIVHHDPAHNDDQLDAMAHEATKECENIFFAQEGQVVTI